MAGGPNAGFAAALTEGYYKDAGLDVTIIQGNGSGNTAQLVANGRAQVAYADAVAVSQLIAKGAPMKIVATIYQSNPNAVMSLKKANIKSVADLKGKKVGVPFVSTTHFHLLYAMELAGLKRTDVNILNMRPPDIAAAWQRGDIDATFIWDPVLSTVKKDGKVIVTSGELCKKGKCTFDGLIVSKKFAAENPQFMTALVKAIAKADADYVGDPKKWTGDKAKVDAVAKWSGGKAEDVPAAMALYGFPSLKDQASPTWLGGGANGGATKALTETAKFLKEEGRIQQLAPDYSKSVNAKFAQDAMK
jgi:taurine transport system substrate-binding protein